MSSDGGLRLLLRHHLRAAQWTTVETGATQGGVPDAEYCFPGGAQGWVECKQTGGLAVAVRPAQVAWHHRRWRAGGLSLFAVRRRAAGGPRRGLPVDELWLVPGQAGEALMLRGLAEDLPPLFRTRGGPSSWDWDAVEAVLRGGLPDARTNIGNNKVIT